MYLPPLVSLPAFAPLAADVSDRITDGVSFAQILAQHLGGSTRDEGLDAVGGSAGDGGLATLASSSLHAHKLAAQSLQDFLAKFRPWAAENGIQLSPPIQLKSDGRGGVVLANDPPDRAKIERLLASRPELSSAFRLLSASQQMATRLSRSPESDLVGEFRLAVGPDSTEVTFE